MSKQYKTLKEVQLNGVQFKVGSVLPEESVTTRMKELKIVELIKEQEVQEPEILTEVEEPKKPRKVRKSNKRKKVEPETEPEILTEDPIEVKVEIEDVIEE